MTADNGGHALWLAHLMGAVQEAHRMSIALVGSEHVLLAAFADPVVRQAFTGVGCDLRDVQDLVGDVDPGDGDRVSDARLTPEAAELIDRVSAGIPDLVPGRRPDPRVLSATYCAIVVTLLHDDRETAARTILHRLDVLRHAPSLVEAMRRSAGSPMRLHPG